MKNIKKTEKRVNRLIIICTMLFSVICLTYSLDWTNTVVTGNKPVFSIQYASEWLYGKCYHSIFYDYFSFNNGRKIIKGTNEQIPYIYELNYEDGNKIELTRIEIIKNKIYIGIPSFLKEMSKISIDGRVNPYILSLYGIKGETETGNISYVFSCYTTDENIENSEVNDKINELIYFYKNYYKENLTISKTYIEQIDNKNIGVIEYNFKSDNIIENHCEFLFEYKGKLIKCDFMITCNELFSNNYMGEYLIKTIEIYD